ncbi:MAG: hypothetical protein V2I33_11655 [Kangiellaceae bacterium]|jgi:hypothetical protein|nr:hypothetical protein [Kangiellaceae bacterium]
MSLQNHLNRLKELLSEEDRATFEALNNKLAECGGDLTQLPAADIDIIEQMELKYGDQIKTKALQHSSDVIDGKQPTKEVVNDFPLLKTEFADYVKDMLLRELSEEVTDLKSAVSYAFETKWLPNELKNPDVCETLYERFCSDIEQTNEWRMQFDPNAQKADSKQMAIGLTWFMYIFQLKQWVDSNQL